MNTIKTSHIYLIFRGVMAFANAIMFTTYAVYYINALHLNPFELLMIGTILEGTIFLFENITGIVADTYSRRRSVLFGLYILGGAYLIEGSIPGLAAVILVPFIWLAFAEVIRGIGETFLSGSATAWVADELGNDKIGKLFIRASQVSIVARIAGAAASMGLAKIVLNLPYLVGGVLFIFLGFYMTTFMKETSFKPLHQEINKRQPPLRLMVITAKNSLGMMKRQPILWFVVGSSIFTGASSEGIDRLWEAHFIKTFHFPHFGHLGAVVWIGLISISVDLLTLVFSEIYNRVFDVNKENVIQTGLFILVGLEIIGVGAFALAGRFGTAVMCYIFFSVGRTLSAPLYSAWINAKIDPNVRASVLSIDSQFNALGQSIVGPGIGYVGTRYTIRAAIMTSSLLLIPTFALFGKVWLASKKVLKNVS